MNYLKKILKVKGIICEVYRDYYPLLSDSDKFEFILIVDYLDMCFTTESPVYENIKLAYIELSELSKSHKLRSLEGVEFSRDIDRLVKCIEDIFDD